ncbi:hypothetical protein ACEPPN_006546 [Leptodophora sp. 'Broadleaf-Isolate-01']
MKALVANRGILNRSANLLAGKSIGNGVKVKDISKPTISEKEILVKVHATALNPIDCKFIDFIAPSDNLLGCEFAGVVADVVAGGVSQERGAFAEYVKAEDDLIWRIPAGVKDGVLPGTTRLWRMDWRRTHISRSWMGFNHRLIHGSVASCMERFLVRIQSWSGEGPYWLVNESECGPTSGAMKQSSSEHGKLEMDEQMDEQLDEQANRKAEDSSVYQAGIVDDFIDVDGCDWVLVELTDRRSKAEDTSAVFKYQARQLPLAVPPLLARCNTCITIVRSCL